MIAIATRKFFLHGNRFKYFVVYYHLLYIRIIGRALGTLSYIHVLALWEKLGDGFTMLDMSNST